MLVQKYREFGYWGGWCWIVSEVGWVRGLSILFVNRGSCRRKKKYYM